LDTVPRNTIAASLVPSPCVNVRPVVCAKVRLPWLTDTENSTSPPATSTSLALIPVMDSNVLSSTDFAPGTVSTGASFTAETVMPIVLLSVSLHPTGVALIINTDIERIAAVEVGGAPVVDRGQRRITFAIVPVNTIDASLVPSPVVNVRPVVCARLIVPPDNRHRDLHRTRAASTSATLMPVIAFAVSSVADCAPGTVSTGKSLTAKTVMAIDLLSVFAPPEPVLP